MTKIYKVGKLNDSGTQSENVYQYGDVTEMTQGQFQQYLEAQRFRLLAEHHGGITNYDAMAESIEPTTPVNVGAFPVAARNGLSKFMRKVSGMTNAAFPNFNGTQKKPAAAFLGTVLTDVLKPLINWIFSIMIPKAAPFFIHVYLDNPYAGPKMLAKKAKQTAILTKIANVTGTPYQNLKDAVKSALYGILGKSPKDWLDDLIMSHVTIPGQNVTVTAKDTAAKGDKIGPGATTTTAKGDKIGNPAAVLAAIAPFIPLIIAAIGAIATIAGKLLENIPDMVGKDQLSDNSINSAAPATDEQGWLNDLSDLATNIFNGSSESTSGNTGTQPFPGQTTSPPNQSNSTNTLLIGTGLALGVYFLFKK